MDFDSVPCSYTGSTPLRASGFQLSQERNLASRDCMKRIRGAHELKKIGTTPEG
jgi:hypothetical protein